MKPYQRYWQIDALIHRKCISLFAFQRAESHILIAFFSYRDHVVREDKASRKSGITGEILLQLLEARLDNTVYRLGIAPTRRAARQLVIHKHITVNGEIVNVPSFTLKNGDVIGVREKSKSIELITNSLTVHSNKFSWLEWEGSSMTGKFLNPPTREEIPENIKEQLIVELYSK